MGEQPELTADQDRVAHVLVELKDEHLVAMIGLERLEDGSQAATALFLHPGGGGEVPMFALVHPQGSVTYCQSPMLEAHLAAIPGEHNPAELKREALNRWWS